MKFNFQGGFRTRVTVFPWEGTIGTQHDVIVASSIRILISTNPADEHESWEFS